MLTRVLHPALSFAILSISPQLIPFSFIPPSNILLHVPFGRPGFLLPAGVHLSDFLTCLVLSILSTCSVYFHLLFFISMLMLLIPVHSVSSLLDTLSVYTTLSVGFFYVIGYTTISMTSILYKLRVD